MMKIILADTLQEGNAYAREQGFRPGDFRVAPRAASIRGIRESEVHQLPSFDQRLDRFALLAELRYNRGPHFVITDGWTWHGINREPAQPELPFDTSATVSDGDIVVDITQTSPEVVEKAVASTKRGVKLNPEEWARLVAGLEDGTPAPPTPLRYTGPLEDL